VSCRCAYYFYIKIRKDISLMKQVFRDSPSLDAALTLMRDALSRHLIGYIDSETIAVRESLGRITAQAIMARCSSPAYHSAAMDGYAVRFRSTIGASETKPLLLPLTTEAVYVDTGDPLPPGFDAVVMIEDVNVVGDFIEIYASASPYQHVRVIGEDIVATEMIVAENHRIRPVDMGALLASGHLEIMVRKRPVVAIIPTGSELVEPETVRDRMPEPPEIIEYNATLLGAMAEESGAQAKRLPIITDKLEAIKAALVNAATSADIIVINAGSGKGSEDFTAQALAELGEIVIHSVAMKPGKPLIFGFIGDTPVFGIPGYPVSAYLTFHLFVVPVIARLLGSAVSTSEKLSAIVSRQLSSSLGVDEFIRVKVGAVGDKLVATPVGRGAGLLMSVVRADGFVRIAADSEGVAAGGTVQVELLRSRESIYHTIVCIGSHDNSLDLLANRLRHWYPEMSLSSAHVGSMGGLMAIARGEAHIAGTHLLDEETGEYNVPYLKKMLSDCPVVLINLAYRQQGFVVRKGNPKGIRSFHDLIRDDVVFVNRQSGSGTRLLLDKYLRTLGIDSARIAGYDHEEYTHMAVASAVLTGLADTGLAVLASAQALDLDFIPVAEERYDLAIPEVFFDDPKIQRLLTIIRDDTEFRSSVQALGGYDLRDMGKLMYKGSTC
jgi:putative molybdopterin biosynthesis protein